jgi:hypothetical protein
MSDIGHIIFLLPAILLASDAVTSPAIPRQTIRRTSSTIASHFKYNFFQFEEIHGCRMLTGNAIRRCAPHNKPLTHTKYPLQFSGKGIEMVGGAMQLLLMFLMMTLSLHLDYPIICCVAL